MTAAARSCGACTACCFVLGIKPIDKAPFSRCPNECRGEGCGIYETRPDPCRNYRCGWLEGFGEVRDRPDKLGVVLDRMAPSAEVQAAADGGDVAARERVAAAQATIRAREVWRKAFDSPRAQRWLKGLHEQGNLVVLVPFGGRKLPVGAPIG